MADILTFFKEKKPWSRYKDLILDYYLEPYLHKVAQLKKPIVVVDCFAGPGKFEDGELGSPRIIANRIKKLCCRGIDAQAIFIESNAILFERLKENISNCGIRALLLKGNFKDHIDKLADLSRQHTMFIYLDPIHPGDLLFDDLKSVYDNLRVGQSIETLVNFLSFPFLRRIRGFESRATIDGNMNSDHPEVLECDRIAGGKYWQQYAYDVKLSKPERVEKIAEGYANQLNTWFKYVLKYPIRKHYQDKQPKYHLIFGSRHPDAVDLMNRAMVKARREFVGSFSVEGMLFPNQPSEEVISPEKINRTVLATIHLTGKTTWRELRTRATINNPCMYTDSELNQAIKKAIRDEDIGSNCSGDRIDNDANVWPIKQPQ